MCSSTYMISTQSDRINREIESWLSESGEGEMKSLFNRFGVSVWDDEKILEMADGADCTTMGGNTTELYWGLNGGHFVVRILL